MLERTYWFFLEPYVYISIKERGIFLYNTLDGGSLHYPDPPAPLADMLRASLDGAVAVREVDTRGSGLIPGFISAARERFMADLVETSCSKGKPAQLMPVLKVEDKVYKEKGRGWEKAGMDIMNRLQELTLYISDSCRQACRICDSAYKQFPFCSKKERGGGFMDLCMLERLVAEVEGTGIQRIDILGGDVFGGGDPAAVFSLLGHIDAEKILSTHYLNITPRTPLEEVLTGNITGVRLLAHFPIREPRFSAALDRLETVGFSPVTTFLVKSREDIDRVGELAREKNIDRFTMQPFFNGGNHTFFEKHVYIDPANLLTGNRSMKTILSRGVFNHFYYGRLVVCADGTIQTGVNGPVVGNLEKDSLHEVLHRELKKEKSQALEQSWFLTRDRVAPCMDCHFNMLCPSISNYEQVIGRNDLCSREALSKFGFDRNQ